MSEEMGSFTDASLVYVPLHGEGTNVCRPTRALPRGDMRFELLATDDYDPEDESWEFPPGSVVVCRVEDRGGKSALIARELAG
jgi:hypothetical protein